MEAPGTTGVLRPEAFHGARTRVARLLRIGGPFTAVDVDATAIAFRGKRDPQVRLSDVSRVRHATGRRWSRLTITTKDGLHRSIGGLPRETAGRLVTITRADGTIFSIGGLPRGMSRAIHDSLVDPSWRQEAALLARLARDPERFRGSANERYRKSERPLARESLNATLPFELNASQVEAAITADDCTLVLAGTGDREDNDRSSRSWPTSVGGESIPAAEILIISYNRQHTSRSLPSGSRSAELDADVWTFHASRPTVCSQAGYAGQFRRLKAGRGRGQASSSRQRSAEVPSRGAGRVAHGRRACTVWIA